MRKIWTNDRSTKRPREGDVNPSTLISGPSTSTLINEPLTESSADSMLGLYKSKNKEHLALKLNCLKEKSAISHTKIFFRARLKIAPYQII